MFPILLYERIEGTALQAEPIHSNLCSNFAAGPFQVDLMPIIRIGCFRPAQMLPFFFGCCNTLRLALKGTHPLLFCNAGQNFDQDIIDHIEDPVLLLRQLDECGGNIQDLYPDMMFLKILKLRLDMALVSAEPVQRHDHQGIPLPKQMVLEHLVPFPFQRLAALLVGYNIPLVYPEVGQRFQLTIQVLFSR